MEVQGATKIEIFEIRDGKNGLQLKNLNNNPRSNQKPVPLLKLFGEPKKPEESENNLVKFAKNLTMKLKSVRGDDKMNRFKDDTLIYILGGDDNNDDSSDRQTPFIDETRNNRAINIEESEIRDLLLQL